MAIPFRRTSKLAKRKRRTHFKLNAPTMVVCPNCGELTLSHQVCKKCGYYKGKLVVEPKPEKTEKTEKTDKTEKVEKVEKVEKTEKAEKAAKVEKKDKE